MSTCLCARTLYIIPFFMGSFDDADATGPEPRRLFGWSALRRYFPALAPAGLTLEESISMHML